MTGKLYTEDIEAVAALGRAQGLVEALRQRTVNITSGPGRDLYSLVHQLDLALTKILGLTDALGRRPTMDWHDPSALRELAEQLQREDDEDAAAADQLRRDVESGRFL